MLTSGHIWPSESRADSSSDCFHNTCVRFDPPTSHHEIRMSSGGLISLSGIYTQLITAYVHRDILFSGIATVKKFMVLKTTPIHAKKKRNHPGFLQL